MANKPSAGKWLGKQAKEGMDFMTKGTIGKLFGAAAIAEIATADNKLKAVWNTLKAILTMKVMMAGFGLAVFGGMSKSIKTLLKDTGSLDQMLRKLSQIQGLRTMFTPLVGGAEAAKKKVAELTNFAARFGKTLGDVGESARSLSIMTRGAFSGSDAMKKIGDAAAATGNDMVGLSDTVGQLYATLRDGGSIAGSVEQLRQMGVVSQGTADSLVTLQENGASATEVFNAATSALDGFAGGMDAAKKSVEGVNKAYAAAVENLQEKFASPFVEDDIKNTQQMTDAMEAVAPSVGRLAAVFNVLTGGLSTAKTMIVSWVAGWAPARIAVEGVISVLMTLITYFGILSGFAMGTFFLTAVGPARSLEGAINKLTLKIVNLVGATGVARTSLIGFGATAAKVGGIVAATGALIASAFFYLMAIGVVVGIFKELYSAVTASAKAAMEFQRASLEINLALDKQISSIKTLTDRHEALAAVTRESAAAQQELTKAMLDGNAAGIEAAKNRLQEIQIKKTTIQGKKENEFAPTDEQSEISRTKVEREKRLKDQEFDNKMSVASPENKIKLLTERTKEKEAERATGQAGIDFKDKTSKSRETASQDEGDAQQEVFSRKEQIAKAKEKLKEIAGTKVYSEGATQDLEEAKERAEDVLKDGEDGLIEAQKQLEKTRDAKAEIGRSAPEGSSLNLETQIRDMESGRSAPNKDESKADAIRRLSEEKDKAQLREENVGANATEVSKNTSDLDQLAKELKLSQDMQAIDEERASIKEQGYEKTKQEFEKEKEKLELMKKFENERTGGADSVKVKELEAQEKALEISREQAAAEHKTAQDLGDLDKQRAESKKEGYEKAKEENDLKIKAIDREIEAAKGRGIASDDPEMKAFEASKADVQRNQRENARENIRNQQSTKDEGDRQKAEISGKGNEITKIDDYSVFEQRRSQLEGRGMDSEQARKEAGQYAKGAITLDDRKTKGDVAAATAVTDLRRIGGGGNMASTSDKGLEIAKRQADLQEKIEENTRPKKTAGGVIRP